MPAGVKDGYLRNNENFISFNAMIKNWKLEKKPCKTFADRGILFIDSSLEEAKLLKKSFTGILGVVFKSGKKDFPWAMYVYGASENILKLIEQEIGVISAGSLAKSKMEKEIQKKEETKEKQEEKKEKKEEFPKPLRKLGKVEEKPTTGEKSESVSATEEFPGKKLSSPESPLKETRKDEEPREKAEKKKPPEKKKQEIKTEKFEGSKEGKGEISDAPVEHFEKLTPDSAPETPQPQPLIERFENVSTASVEDKRAESKSVEKSEKPRTASQVIKIVYFCPEAKKDLISQVKTNIETIISEKNINFNFEAAAVVIYGKNEPRQDIIGKVLEKEFDFVIAIAPDENDENILRELKRKGFIPKVITEDNIDKKFRYLNLITDIVLSPRK